MTRLVVLASLLVAATAALAHGPPGPPDPNRPKKDPALYEKCHQLARERGWLPGGWSKGAIKPSKFIGDCMRGQQLSSDLARTG
jgi:hypothetical protein